jgi:cholinesterase
MMNQVKDFADQVSAGKIHFDPDKATFFLLGGLNDAKAPDGQTKTNLENEIDILHRLGARRVQVGNLPTAIPTFKAVVTRLNPQIEGIPEEEHRLHPDLDVQILNWGKDYAYVFEHAADFGIVNTWDKCAGGALFNQDATPCPAPDTYYFFHDSHPSTAVHRAVGDLLYQQLTQPEP